jgi:Glycosyl transferase family 2
MHSRGLVARPVVAVPAKNEAERLPILLRALAAQSWMMGSHRPLDVVIVLNNCSDESPEIVRMAAALHVELNVDLIEADFPCLQAHVGSARRLAMQRAQHLGGPSAILISTDADATPDPDWIKASLRAIQAGADIVGGHLIGDKSEEKMLGPGFNRRATQHLRYAALVDRLKSLFDPIDHDPWPRHCDHTGASIAVRAEVYKAVGGIPAISFREDMAFVANAVAAGYRLRHAPDVRVGVSARLQGRAQGGMADCLKAWIADEAAGLPHLVESADCVRSRLNRGARQQTSNNAGLLSAASKRFNVHHSLKTMSAKPSAPTMEIETAIQQLTEMIADHEDAIHVT